MDRVIIYTIFDIDYGATKNPPRQWCPVRNRPGWLYQRQFNEETEPADRTQSNHRNDENKRDEKTTDKRDNRKLDHDEKTEHDEENTEQGDIPRFDRDEFDIDSDVIHLQKLAYRDHKLNIQVMVTATDKDTLAEELRALAPRFERAIRDADVDAEEFFAEIHQIKFMLYDEHKTTVFAIFLDLQWLREFLDDEMTDQEFAERMCEQMPSTQA